MALEAEPKKIKTVGIIVNCWIKLLNTKPLHAYDQIYLKSLFLSMDDILLLARDCPLEFDHFICELKKAPPKRSL